MTSLVMIVYNHSSQQYFNFTKKIKEGRHTCENQVKIQRQNVINLAPPSVWPWLVYFINFHVIAVMFSLLHSRQKIQRWRIENYLLSTIIVNV